MTFSGLGPEPVPQSAWGQRSNFVSATARQSSRRKDKRSGDVVQSKPGGRTSGPKIVTTPKSRGKYPVSIQIQKVDPIESCTNTTTSRARKVKGPRPMPRLASSTAKPKPRSKPKVPKAGAWNVKPKTVDITKFRVFYQRGDLPVCIEHGAKRKLLWKTNIDRLDYHLYLPLFMDGLREAKEPYSFLAHRGVQDLLDNGGDRILPVVPQLVPPLKKALDTKNKAIIARTMQVIQTLCTSAPHVGEALVPFYRVLLPVFNTIFLLEKRQNFNDGIDYGQRKRENLIDLATETLEIMETTGGESAFVNIKYMLPIYESATAYFE